MFPFDLLRAVSSFDFKSVSASSSSGKAPHWVPWPLMPAWSPPMVVVLIVFVVQRLCLAHCANSKTGDTAGGNFAVLSFHLGQNEQTVRSKD